MCLQLRLEEVEPEEQMLRLPNFNGDVWVELGDRLPQFICLVGRSTCIALVASSPLGRAGGADPLYVPVREEPNFPPFPNGAELFHCLLYQIAVFMELKEYLLDELVVSWIRCPAVQRPTELDPPLVNCLVPGASQLYEGLENSLMVLIHHRLWGLPALISSDSDWRPVLIGPTKHQHTPAPHPLVLVLDISREAVPRNVSKVEWPVRIWPGHEDGDILLWTALHALDREQPHI